MGMVFTSLQSQFICIWWAFYDIVFSLIFLKVKGMKTAQMFFEDYMGPSESEIAI